MLSPDDVGLHGAALPEEETSAGPGDFDVESEEAAVDGVPSLAVVDFVLGLDEAAPDPAAPDVGVTGAENFVVAAASTQ